MYEMSEPYPVPVRRFDGLAWRTATWSAPLLVQVVLATQLLFMWALGQWPFATHSAHAGEAPWMLASTVCTMLTSSVFVVVLAKSPNPRRRALALSLGCCSATVFFGAIVFAGVLLR